MKNYASFGRRFVAVFIDGLILGLVSSVLSYVFGSGAVPFMRYSYGYGYPTAFPFGMVIVPTLITWGYYTYFIGSRGQTVGKMAMGIKVVDLKTRTHPDYMHAFLREIVGKFVSGIVLLLGYLWMLWDGKKQTWHDKIAGTVVVRV